MSKLKARQPEEVLPGKAKGIIFGASGVGKTWFSLMFPSPYYIDTEGGASLKHYQERLEKSGGVYMGPSDGALDFDTIIDQVRALATEKHGYKTLIIDSITKVFQTTIANESERLGVRDAFGASKKPAIAKMRQLVNWITRLDMNVWFVAHEIAEWGEINGQRTEIGKVPDCWDKLVFELDLGLRVIKRGKEFPATAFIHKSRLLGFPQYDAFSLQYDEFAKRYGRDYIESEGKHIVIASENQIADIVRLSELLKVTDEDKEKILKKASAIDWNELSEDQANSVLEWLRNKIKGETK